jgi:hypothetical protein
MKYHDINYNEWPKILQRRRLHETKDTIWEGAPKTSQQIAEKASQAKGTVLEGSLGKRHCS